MTAQTRGTIYLCKRLLLLLCSTSFLVACSAKPSPSLISARLLEEQYGVIEDPLTQRYLEGILVRLSSATLTRHHRTAREAPQLFPTLTLLASAKPVALAPNQDSILISQGMILAVANEAELAFVLAHERAHQQLGHTDLKVDTLSASARKNIELAADQRAIAVMAAAGYDPRAAFSALQRTDFQNRARDSFPQAPAKANYPSLDERQNAALEFLNDSGWLPPGTINRRDFVMIQRRLRIENAR
jgi:predicted Zn-dependent protease